jgi:hypothetical protein
MNFLQNVGIHLSGVRCITSQTTAKRIPVLRPLSLVHFTVLSLSRTVQYRQMVG